MAADAGAAFAFAFHPLFRPIAAVLGVTPDTTSVVVDAEELVARFGRWCVATPLDNVTEVHVTGPFAVPKVIGPAHVSLVDRGLTFATNPDAGVCIRFRQPVGGADPWGLLRHPALTVTVAEPEALAGLLETVIETGAGPGDVEARDHVEALTARELRTRARDLGIRGASKMKRDELVALLEGHAEA